MYKNFTLTESEKERILNMHKKPLNEQDLGGYKEGPGDKQMEDFNHYNKIVKPKLLAAGFKDMYDKNMEQYGTSNSMVYGDHSTGVNVLFKKSKTEPFSYVVWVGDNKGLKTFPLGGGNNSKMVADNAFNYAIQLKNKVR
jgi:hypothetical protein